MGDYRKWLLDALEMLEDDYRDRSFKPESESDVKCHLYHTLLNTKDKSMSLSSRHLVLSEYPIRELKRKFDLVLCSTNRKKSRSVTRLVIEIKKTKNPKLGPKSVERRIKADIDKLNEYRKMLQNKGENGILRELRRSAIVFFFIRGADPKKKAELTEDLRKLRQMHRDVVVWWGPKQVPDGCECT